MTNSLRPSLTLEGLEGLFISSVDIVPRTGHDSLRRRELRLARVSMCIVILYMVCHAPKLLPTLLELLQEDPKVQFKTLLWTHCIVYFSLENSLFHRSVPSPADNQQQPQLSYLLHRQWSQPELSSGKMEKVVIQKISVQSQNIQQLLLTVQ